MAAIKSRGSKPEMAVRRLAHFLGFRFRLHRSDLPGKPDLVFGPRRKVIFVHGCFWHQHDRTNCLDGRLPKSNTAYWKPKLLSNVDRDRDNIAALISSGWKVLVVWECEVVDRHALKQTLLRFLSP